MGLEILRHNIDIVTHAVDRYVNFKDQQTEYQSSTPGLKSFKDIEPYDMFIIAPGTLIFSVNLQRMIMLPEMEYIEIIGKSSANIGDILVFNLLVFDEENNEFDVDTDAGSFDVNYTYLLPTDFKRRNNQLKLNNNKPTIL